MDTLRSPFELKLDRRQQPLSPDTEPSTTESSFQLLKNRVQKTLLGIQEKISQSYYKVDSRRRNVMYAMAGGGLAIGLAELFPTIIRAGYDVNETAEVIKEPEKFVEMEGFHVFGVEKPIQSLEQVSGIYKQEVLLKINLDDSLSENEKKYLRLAADEWFATSGTKSKRRRQLYNVLHQYFLRDAMSAEFIVTKSVWDQYANDPSEVTQDRTQKLKWQSYPKAMRLILDVINSAQDYQLTPYGDESGVWPVEANSKKITPRRIIILEDAIAPKEQFMNGNRGLDIAEESPFSSVSEWSPDISDQRLYIPMNGSTGTNLDSGYNIEIIEGWVEKTRAAGIYYDEQRTLIDHGQAHEILHAVYALGDYYWWINAKAGAAANPIIQKIYSLMRNFNTFQSFTLEPDNIMTHPGAKKLSWADVLTTAAFRAKKHMSLAQPENDLGFTFIKNSTQEPDTVMSYGTVDPNFRRAELSFRFQPVESYGQLHSNTPTNAVGTSYTYYKNREVSQDEFERLQELAATGSQQNISLADLSIQATETQNPTSQENFRTVASSLDLFEVDVHNGKKYMVRELIAVDRIIDEDSTRSFQMSPGDPGYNEAMMFFLQFNNGQSSTIDTRTLHLPIPSKLMDLVHLLCEDEYINQKNIVLYTEIFREAFPHYWSEQFNMDEIMEKKKLELIGEFLTTSELKTLRQNIYNLGPDKLFSYSTANLGIRIPLAQVKFPSIDDDLRKAAGLPVEEELHYVISMRTERAT